MFDYQIAASIALESLQRLLACGGTYPIHPISWTLLTDYVRGAASREGFLAGFYMPDSSLIAVGQCIADAM